VVNPQSLEAGNYHVNIGTPTCKPLQEPPTVTPIREPSPNAELNEPTNAEPDPYPMLSDLFQASLHPEKRQTLPTINTHIRKAARAKFVSTKLSPNVQAMLEQDFGKPNCNQSFVCEPRLRHVLLPLWFSGMLQHRKQDNTDITDDWANLCAALPATKTLLDLLAEHGDIDFNPLKSYPKDWENETEVNQHRVKMTTAALLYFQGDVAATIRWIGGPYAAEHRDHKKILAFCKGKVDELVLKDLTRQYYQGSPAHCNAADTEANYQAYRTYGNHSTVDAAPDQTKKALVKDTKKSYALAADQRAVDFLIHIKLTPIGIINLQDQWKKDRVIFDSTFHPTISAMAINDWTNPKDEPPITFADAFPRSLIRVWNMRITYPNEEIYPADDDVAGAFRNDKYSPVMGGMQCCLICGFLILQSGTTFGDNTSPSNWDTIAVARQQLADKLWTDEKLCEQARCYLPEMTFSPDPTTEETATFAQAEPDAINTGVLDAEGKRTPPGYPHHVDDNLYCDTRSHMFRTVAASVLALYILLGFPRDEVPNAVSQDKLETSYTWTRKHVGFTVNTRSLEVIPLQEKTERLIQLLTDWETKTTYTLKEAAILAGSLESHTRYTKWARPWFFAIQNAIRHALRQRYHIAARILNRQGRLQKYQRELPHNLQARTDSLIARDMAKLLWNSHQQIDMTDAVRSGIRAIRTSLQDANFSWAAKIAFIIPRTPHAHSVGDASDIGGGGYSTCLRFWFDIVWSQKIARGRKLKATEKGYVHINSLEYIVIIIQLAAVIVRLAESPPDSLTELFPNGAPKMPVLLCQTDNTSAMAWSNRLTSKSLQGQHLIGIFAELLRQHNIGINAEHLAGYLNVLADFLSRPTHMYLTHAQRSEQIFQKYSSMRTWDYFQPSPELLQALSSLLLCDATPAPPKLPKKLGQFIRAGCTTSCSVIL
jgi:hypothetical protein